jgi:hypothetical protein
LLILDDCSVIERAQQRSATLKLSQQALVINIEAKRSCGRVEICAIDEDGDLTENLGRCRPLELDDAAVSIRKASPISPS